MGYWRAPRVFRSPSRLFKRTVRLSGLQRKKRDFELWITRINAQSRANGLTYSRLINGLKRAEIALDRRVLADLAVHDKEAFAAVVERARTALAA